jgi:hypothetical protein
MILFAAALAAILTAQRPLPPINFSLPGGQSRAAPPAPLTIPPDAEMLAFQDSAVLTRPAAAVRHFILSSAAPIPPHGAPFTVRCLIDRANGRVFHCQDPAVADPWRAAAVALGSLYQFRLTPAQAAANPRPLAVVISDRITPADVRPRARLFQFTGRSAGNVTVTGMMPGAQSEAYYPARALAIGLEARIRVDCRVQDDLGLFCIDPAAAAGTEVGPLLPDFQRAALQLSAWLRAAPTLSNGAASPGTVFRTTITFRLPRE